MTDWSDRELNTPGLTLVEECKPSRRVSVVVEAKALAYFTDPEGHTYVCTFFDDPGKRHVFIQTDDGFLKVTDPNIRFVAATWTGELFAARRS
jgi:hypothetical protein